MSFQILTVEKCTELISKSPDVESRDLFRKFIEIITEGEAVLFIDETDPMDPIFAAGQHGKPLMFNVN